MDRVEKRAPVARPRRLERQRVRRPARLRAAPHRRVPPRAGRSRPRRWSSGSRRSATSPCSPTPSGRPCSTRSATCSPTHPDVTGPRRARSPLPGRLLLVRTGLKSGIPRTPDVCVSIADTTHGRVDSRRTDRWAVSAAHSRRRRDRAGRGDGPGAGLRARPPARAPAPRHDLRPRARRARRARRPLLLLHGWVATRRPELVPGLRAARRALPRDRARPPRPRPGHPLPPGLPPRRLRRRLRGDARRARHRPGDRGRLLDGRPGRAAAVAPPPRPRRRARALRDVGRLHAEPARSASRTSRRCSPRSPRRAPATLAARCPALPASVLPAARHAARGPPTRCAATTGA